MRRRTGFINNHFWATRYKPDEMSAAGVYPNQSGGGDGLPRWIGNNENLVNQDVVVWYTLGVSHIPRPEEWPVMPVTHVGFKLIPGGFFSRGIRRSMCPNKRVEVLIRQRTVLGPLHEIFLSVISWDFVDRL